MKKIALISFLVLIIITTVIGVLNEITDISAIEPESINPSTASNNEIADTSSSSTEQASASSGYVEIKADDAVAENDNSYSKYFIAINLSTNKLTLYQGDDKNTSYDVATGKIVDGISSTPTGQFIILNKVQDPAWGGGGYADPIAGGDPNNPLGHYWIGISAGDNPGGSIGIHGNINEASIGTHASHGCIRMHNSDVPNLFEIIPLNTEVWIGTSEQLSEWGVENFD